MKLMIVTPIINSVKSVEIRNILKINWTYMPLLGKTIAKCSHCILVPAAFLAINAEADTENGNITKLRRLEINWYNIDGENTQGYRYS